jgi:hypothetical protein
MGNSESKPVMPSRVIRALNFLWTFEVWTSLGGWSSPIDDLVEFLDGQGDFLTI